MLSKKIYPMQLTKLIGLLFVFFGALFYFSELPVVNQYSTASKTLRFNYTLSNASGEFIPHVDFFVKIPMQIDSVQSVKSINSSYKNELIQGSDGEQNIGFSIDSISPYSSKLVDLTLVVDISNEPRYERINNADYLHAEKYIESNSPLIKALSAQLKSSSPEETARNIYEWLVNNITSLSYTTDSKGAQYLIEKKSGDCTELMYAFVALARANGVPARGVNGFWLPTETTIINSADYHDWAEFYDGKRWVLVDPMRQHFDSNEAHYLKINLFSASKASRTRFSVSNSILSVSF